MLKNKGITLIELLISLVLSSIILLALTSFIATNINHYNETLSRNKLAQQLEISMQLMAAEIRRAGYWANANTDIAGASNTNPFMSTTNGTDLTIPNTSCILFTYDKNNSGTLPSISSSSDDERYGFRLSGQALQARPQGATFSCTASSTAWENITDPNVISITNLTFTLSSTTVTSGSQSILQRNVTISITGTLANNSNITKTLTQTVRVMNDKYS